MDSFADVCRLGSEYFYKSMLAVFTILPGHLLALAVVDGPALPVPVLHLLPGHLLALGTVDGPALPVPVLHLIPGHLLALLSGGRLKVVAGHLPLYGVLLSGALLLGHVAGYCPVLSGAVLLVLGVALLFGHLLAILPVK